MTTLERMELSAKIDWANGIFERWAPTRREAASFRCRWKYWTKAG
jgi:hypothetical protein